MSKVKIIKKKGTASGIDINDYKNILNGLSGDKKFLDPIIVLDKYMSMKDNVNIINALLKSFNKTIVKYYSEQDYEIFLEYTNKLDKLFEGYDIQLNNVIDIYYQIKNSDEIAEILNILKNLNIYHKDIDKDDVNDIDTDFILNNICGELKIFTFGSINLIDIYLRFDNEKTLKYLILLINKIYKPCKEIYKLLTSPDVNPQKLADLIISAITQLKTRVKGCDKAFSKIEQSIDMIVNNMDKYYKMFVTTKNPEAIFSGFLNDLSSDEALDDDIDLTTIMQVKKIMQEFKKMTANKQNKNKEVIDGLFGQMDDIFTMLENDI